MPKARVITVAELFRDVRQRKLLRNLEGCQVYLIATVLTRLISSYKR